MRAFIALTGFVSSKLKLLFPMDLSLSVSSFSDLFFSSLELSFVSNSRYCSFLFTLTTRHKFGTNLNLHVRRLKVFHIEYQNHRQPIKPQILGKSRLHFSETTKKRLCKSTMIILLHKSQSCINPNQTVDEQISDCTPILAD